MEYRNVLDIRDRDEFRGWLEKNHDTEKECWLSLKMGKPQDDGSLYYLDAVEEALCFGWIDNTIRMIDGTSYRRFSPRQKKGNWTELNKERVRRLEKLGKMTDAGRAVLPKMGRCVLDKEIVSIMKERRIYSKFKGFPALYQRVRVSNLAFYRDNYPDQYPAKLDSFIEKTKNGEMYGEWNDYGRLLDY